MNKSRNNILFKSSMLLLTSLALIGCNLEDDEPNPNDDTMWTQQFGAAGLGRTWTELDSAAAKCDVIDIDGDGADDSRKYHWNFNETDYTGTHNVKVFIDKTDCSGSSDYTDDMAVSYSIYSSEFDFNRIDFSVTSISRTPYTVVAVDLLNGYNSGAGACSLNNWAMSELVDAQSCTNTDANSIDGFYHSTGPSTQLEGIYRVEASSLVLHWRIVGDRPDGTNNGNLAFNYSSEL